LNSPQKLSIPKKIREFPKYLGILFWLFWLDWGTFFGSSDGIFEISDKLFFKSLIEYSKSLNETFKSLMIERWYQAINNAQISIRDFEISDGETEISVRKTDRETEISYGELDQASQARHTTIVYSET
jgi:hypothetical protein